MNLQTALRYLAISCLFLVPFVGLVLANFAFFPFITGKNIAFRVLVDIAAIAYGIIMLTEMLTEGNNTYGKYIPKMSAVLAAGCAFIGVIFIADIFGENFTRSFWSNFERMEGMITFLHLGLYIFLLVVFFKKEVIWRRFFQVIVAASITYGIAAISLARRFVMGQLIGRQLQENEQVGVILKQIGAEGVNLYNTKFDAYRFEGTLGNSTYVGAFAMLAIFIATYLSLRLLRSFSEDRKLKNGEPHVGYEEYNASTAWWWLGFYVISIIFNFYLLFHSGTRSAMIGMFLALLFASIVLSIFERKSKLLRGAAIAVLAGIILSVSVLFIAKDTEFVKSSTLLSRFAKVFTTSPFELFQTEGKGRVGIWKVALDGYKERPILGWGQDNFLFAFGKYYDANLYDQEQWFDRAHNVFLDWMIAGGTLGILSYLSIYLAIIYLIWKRREYKAFSLEEKVALTSLLIGYFIHNLFVFDSITSYIVFATLIAFISYRSTAAKHINVPDHEQHIIKNPQALHALFPTAIIILALFMLYYGGYVSYASSHDIISARRVQLDPQLGYDASYKLFQDIFDRGSIGEYEAREMLIQKTVEVLGSATSVEEKQKWYEFVISQFNQQIKDYPTDSRTYLTIGNFYQQVGDFGNAEKNFLLARQHSPEKTFIFFQLGQLYMNLGVELSKKPDAKKEDIKLLYDKSMEVYQEAIDLSPANPMAHRVMAYAGVQEQRYDIADRELNWLRTESIRDEGDRIARYEMVAADVVFQVYQSNKDLPTRGSSWLKDRLMLAELYVKAGRVEEAKILFTRTSELVKDFGKAEFAKKKAELGL